MAGETGGANLGAYVNKVSGAPYGSNIWRKAIGTTADDVAYAVASDPTGNVVAAGYTRGVLAGAANAGQTDVFVRKLLGTDGSTLWTQQFGSTGTDIAWAAGTDAAGNVIVAGSSNGTAFVRKMAAADGGLTWEVTMGAGTARGVSVDGDGNVIATGETTADLGGGGNAGLTDAFVRKLSAANGSVLWTAQFGTADSEVGNAVDVDNSGNVFVTGNTTGDVDGGSGNAGDTGQDLFVRKLLGTDGSAVWTKQFGVAPGDDVADAISVDGAGDVVIGGNSSNDLDGEGAPGALLYRLSTVNGTVLWVEQFREHASAIVTGVATDSVGHLLITGHMPYAALIFDETGEEISFAIEVD
jgi:hypothetical protein